MLCYRMVYSYMFYFYRAGLLVDPKLTLIENLSTHPTKVHSVPLHEYIHSFYLHQCASKTNTVHSNAKKIVAIAYLAMGR